MKKTFLLFLLFSFWLIPQKVSAADCGGMICQAGYSSSNCIDNNGNYDGYPGITNWQEACCATDCMQNVACNACGGFYVNQTCNKGISSAQCGSNWANCPSDRSECCATGNSWTKYKVQCINTTTNWDDGVTCEQRWVVAGDQCSIGDKCVTNNGSNSGNCSENGLRSSGCGCNSYSSSVYLYCCDDFGRPELAVKAAWADDGTYPPEAQCPGGYKPDGFRVKTLAQGTCLCANGPVNGGAGSCGGAANVATCDAPTANKCADGSNPAVTSSGGYFRWTCPGTGGSCGGPDGAGADCTAQDLPPVNGINGVCASPPNGTTVSTAPTGTLCSSGTGSWTDQVGTDGTFNWNCLGTGGSCSGSNGTTANCWALKNSPPVFGGLVVKNNLGTGVAAEAVGNKNQVCDSRFNGSRVVTFEVSVSDPDGIGDIANITLSWNGTPITRLSAFGAVTTFGADFSNDFNNGNTYPLVVTITDSAGQRATNNSRSFKFWNCEVPVSGTVYDGSSASPAIECYVPTGFTNSVGNINFTGLTFKNVNGDKAMTVNSPNYSSGANSLTWGKIYTFAFNAGIGMNVGGAKMKLSNNVVCQSDINLTDSVTADPYAASPSLDADFAAVVDQDPWWQAVGGGVVSNNQISSRVPVTCNGCKVSANSLVSAPSFSNAGQSKSSAQEWFYNGKLVDINKNYGYFKDQYYAKNGIGTFLTGDRTIADIGATGVYFIDGNLTIDNDKDIDIDVGEFLMIIVKDDINITQNVNNVDGILVAKNINADGTSPNQLNFYGSLFASDTVNLSRGYDVKSTNNSSPAVKVNYSPQLLFKLPGILTKSLTNFRWGN